MPRGDPRLPGVVIKRSQSKVDEEGVRSTRDSQGAHTICECGGYLVEEDNGRIWCLKCGD